MKIAVIDKVHDVLIERLVSKGFQVDDKRNIAPEEVENILSEYDGIVIRSKIKLSAEILSKLTKLKFISRVGAGMESIDCEFAKKQGIVLMNSPEGNRDSVGEHATGMILSLFHKICHAQMQVSKGIWDRDSNRGIELMGKTVGIIGYGNMGSSFAKRLSGFGVNVISYDKYKTNYSDGFTKEVQMLDIFKNTDVLSLHVPLQDDTHFLVNKEYLEKFEKNIYLINTARGKVVKTDDLVEKLKCGKVLGAALDVLEYENVSFEKLSIEQNDSISFLQKSNNVILTPHVAGLSYESNIKLAEITAQKIIDRFSNN